MIRIIGLGHIFCVSSKDSVARSAYTLVAASLFLASCGIASSSHAPLVNYPTTSTLPVIIITPPPNPSQQSNNAGASSSDTSLTEVSVPLTNSANNNSPAVTTAVAAASSVESSPTTEVGTTVTTTTLPASTTMATSPTTSQVVQGSSLPTLGLSGAYWGGVGFGDVEPSTVSLGGDAVGAITGVKWNTWGDSTATGSAVAAYVAPGEAAATATKEDAVVVAFNLGLCNGKVVYRDLVWYFPQYGESQNLVQAIPTCPVE